MFQWTFRYSVRVSVTSGNVRTDAFFFLLSPTLFFLFIIYVISPSSATAVHAGIDVDDVYSSVKHKLCPKSHTSVSIPKCSTFLCSALIAWCSAISTWLVLSQISTATLRFLQFLNALCTLKMLGI